MTSFCTKNIDPYFKESLTKYRWPDGVVCPHCNTRSPYETNRGYKCTGCGKKFSLYSGTAIDNLKLSPFKLIVLVSAFAHWKRKRISSITIAKEALTTQKTAWHLIQKIKAHGGDYNAYSSRKDREACILINLLKNKQ